MRETGFIKQNKEKWVEFEQTLKQKKKDPDSLSNLFVQVTDDLSYSRTFYPNRSVRVYLNNLAQQIFQSIYKNKKEKGNRFAIFWKEELPFIMYQTRKELLVSFLVFALAMGIGVLSSAYDPEFYRLILGDSYVEMTKENIRTGDPMAVYKKRNEIDMFLGITINNLFVAFYTFILGVIMSIGTLAFLLYNGIMVGSFQYFFVEQGLFRESFLTIWMHGTLEISAIVIAGSAGIVMGNGLVFPGTYSRLQSFQVSARRAIKIMLGITPIFVFAAFIEGFLTRYTDLPDPVRLAVILLSLFFILGYFVWYPRHKANEGFENIEPESRLNANGTDKIEFAGIKSNGEVFIQLFIFYRIYLKQIITAALVLAGIFSISTYFVLREKVLGLYTYYGTDSMNSQSYFNVFENLYSYLNYKKYPVFYLFNTVFFSLLVFAVYYLLAASAQGKTQGEILSRKHIFTSLRKRFPTVIIFIALLNTIFFIPDGGSFFLFALVSPFLFLVIYACLFKEAYFLPALNHCRKILKGNWLNLLGLALILSLLGSIYFFVFNSPFLFFYFEIITWNLNVAPETLSKIFQIFITFISLFTMGMVVPIVLIGIGLKFHSLLEINEANELKQRINNIGIKKQRYGMDVED
ncbi:MAG: stage II sporulation protein M [Bacteroidia bacterium]